MNDKKGGHRHCFLLSFLRKRLPPHPGIFLSLRSEKQCFSSLRDEPLPITGMPMKPARFLFFLLLMAPLWGEAQDTLVLKNRDVLAGEIKLMNRRGAGDRDRLQQAGLPGRMGRDRLDTHPYHLSHHPHRRPALSGTA